MRLECPLGWTVAADLEGQSLLHMPPPGFTLAADTNTGLLLYVISLTTPESLSTGMGSLCMDGFS